MVRWPHKNLWNNQWNCLWCGITFQGMHPTKYLVYVIQIGSTHIKSFNAAIDQDHLPRYKYIKRYKAAKKTILNDHMHKVNFSIARIQDNSSKVIDNTIHRKMEVGLCPIFLKNQKQHPLVQAPTFQKTVNQWIINQVIWIFCGIYYQRIISYRETHLKVAISDLIISEGLSINPDQKPWLNKVLDLESNL